MKGFTLLEIMIALAIMAGVLLTVITSFNFHLGLAARDREETVAILLARAMLDDPAFAKMDRKDGTFAPEWPEIAWRADLVPAQFPGVDQLTFTVTWDNGGEKLSLVRYQVHQ